jgi:5'-deoxynucleotidase
MREAFGDIEDKAEDELLALLPAELRDDFAPYVRKSCLAPEEHELIKAADRLSALFKCRAEISAGNKEFEPAERQIAARLQEESLPELTYFLEVFAPGYQQPLDNLLSQP